MAAVLSVTTARPRDGKFQATLALYGRLKKEVERLGGKVRITQQLYGAAPGTVSFIVEVGSWAEFGALTEKGEKDAGYQAILAEARANPLTDIVQRFVSTEIEA